MLRAFFFLLVALLAGSRVSSARSQQLSNVPADPAVRNAIDDFDGDYHPDQIAVQTGASEFSGTQYWIEVRLSTAAPQRIPVFSVPGGIQVVARDVNGNGHLDLVLTASSLRRPVAILLNDGHGRFTRVDPDEFPSAFQNSGTNWESRGHTLDDYAGLPPSSRFVVVLAARKLWAAPSPVARLAPAHLVDFLSLALAPHAGRAPPLSVLL
ncbi:MAG TPA: VCBS repeat-containing protein [Candidatus Acidoferrales bacterium]